MKDTFKSQDKDVGNMYFGSCQALGVSLTGRAELVAPGGADKKLALHSLHVGHELIAVFYAGVDEQDILKRRY